MKKPNKKKLRKVGYSPSRRSYSASFLAVDGNIANITGPNNKNNIEITPIAKAAEKYLWLAKYSKTIDKDTLGYFIRIPVNSKVNLPIQTCFYMKASKSQIAQNVFIAEPNSRIYLISGCTASTADSKHMGMSHYHIKKNASLSIVRIHDWPKSTSVSANNSIILEKNASLLSHNITLAPGKTEQNSTIIKVRENGIIRSNTLLYARENSNCSISEKVLLEEKGSRAEIISKALSNKGTVLTKVQICGNAENTKGHIECDALLLNKKGKMHTIPELQANHPKTSLSHEAAIGKISDKELNYLMSRGITEDTARSLIISGFLKMDTKGLPESLKRAITQLTKKIIQEGTC